MPYISKEDSKEIRARIKKENPNFKFSITTPHGNTLSVAIMEGPIDIEEKYMTINHYYYKEHLKDQPELVSLLDNIIKCIDSVNKPTTLVEDGDYGAVPTYYRSFSVGKWDKLYKKTER